MPVERRGQVIRVMINLANWQQDEPTGCGGGRQPSMDGTSRVMGDYQARFCEGLGVKFPGPTRQTEGTIKFDKQTGVDRSDRGPLSDGGTDREEEDPGRVHQGDWLSPKARDPGAQTEQRGSRGASASITDL